MSSVLTKKEQDELSELFGSDDLSDEENSITDINIKYPIWYNYNSYQKDFIKGFYSGFIIDKGDLEGNHPLYNTVLLLKKSFDYLGDFEQDQLKYSIFDRYDNRDCIISLKELADSMFENEKVFKFQVNDDNVKKFIINTYDEEKYNGDLNWYKVVFHAKDVNHVIDLVKKQSGIDLKIEDVVARQTDSLTGKNIHLRYEEPKQIEKKISKSEKKEKRQPSLFGDR
jgi:hypothetical protein